MAKNIKIKLNDTTNIVAELNEWSDEFPPEICVYLEQNDSEYGFIFQDIAIVRHGLVNDKAVQVLVYGDENNEDYTDAFEIGIYKDEN